MVDSTTVNTLIQWENLVWQFRAANSFIKGTIPEPVGLDLSDQGSSSNPPCCVKFKKKSIKIMHKYQINMKRVHHLHEA